MRTSALLRLALGLAVLLPSARLSPASAGTVRVPADQPTIQEGIEAASVGDTVLVAPGIYTGALNREMWASGRTVVSESGAEATILDCEELGRAFNFGDHWSAPAVIEGFTIRNGCPPFGDHDGGGGMRLGGDVVVRSCVLEDCRAGGGGGICCYNYTHIIDCTFVRCWASGGGGVSLGGHSSVENCVFVDNWAHQRGGAVVASGLGSNAAVISGCTFVGNRSQEGGAVYCGYDEVHVYHNVIAFNEGAGSLACMNPDDDHQVYQNIVFGNADGDSLCGSSFSNMFVDPLFCDLYEGTGARRDLGLCTNSPCLPELNPWGLAIGALGEACGDCVSPVELRSWGRLKALYR